MPTAAFDMLGTFFSLESLRPRLARLGAPPQALELWFAEALRDFFALSHAGGYAPVRTVLEGALPRLLAQQGLEEARAGEVLAGLAELEPAPGAREACELLTGAGWRLLALTNGAEASTHALLERAGLRGHFHAVLSTDAVQRTKPHPEVYGLARAQADGALWMVAAHAWDLMGAARAGLHTAWVTQKERRWQRAWPPPEVEGADLAEVARAMRARVH